MRRPRSGLLWAGSGRGTLVENLKSVPGAAEAVPSGREPQVQLPMAEITSSRWRTHLGDWQREDVARHVKQSSVELNVKDQARLLLAESPLLEVDGI